MMREQAESTILVVNDTPDQLEMMRYMLRQTGYNILTATDGREGYETACREHPDLIISDVIMPNMDGIEMCRLIRQHADLWLTPVLLVSAVCRDSQSVIAGLQAGADDYLESPWDPMRLVVKVAQLSERKRAAAALQTSETELRALLMAITDVIVVLDVNGRYLKIAPTKSHLFYAPPEQLLGKTLHDLFPAQKADFFLDQVRLALTSRQTQVVEYKLRYGDETVWFDASVTPMSEDAVFWVARDITARKRLEEQLRQSQKLEAIGQLVGGITHDFNNLLTSIIGYSQLALQELERGDPMRDNLTEILRAGECAADLTRRLLAFSRNQLLQPKVIDVNTILENLDRMLRRVIGEDIDLATVLSSDLGRVKVDAGQIEQVILNLVVNARDAMPEGGNLTIETHNIYLDAQYAGGHLDATPGSYIMIAVSDTGRGMDEKTQQHIFEPFFTTKEAGKGTGLGLSTVYGIVKQSGGTIAVYSEVGKGTAFKLYLPRVDTSAELNPRLLAAHEMPRGAETILLAEDDEMVRNLTRNVLELHGYRVLEAANASAALQICEQYQAPIHLLLTDMVMPAMSGGALVECLVKMRPDVAILYMSGYTPDAVVHHGTLPENANFIHKPFRLDSLAQKVREVLDAAQK